MKRGFSCERRRIIYKHLTLDIPGTDISGILAVDSYGGAVNKPGTRRRPTSIPQRASVLKLQFQSYWQNPKDDAGRLKWMRDFYTDLYSGPDADPAQKAHLGTTPVRRLLHQLP